MKVENMTSSRGNKVPNQFVIIQEDCCGLNTTYFQSYNVIVAKKDYKNIAGKGLCCFVSLDEKYWNYSTTTSKYRNIFLGETTKETLRKIKSGEYILTKLN